MIVYGATRGKHIPRRYARLTAELIYRLGGDGISRQDGLPEDAEYLIQWGGAPTPALEQAYERKLPFIILNAGYFDDTRHRHFSISINGFHGISMPYLPSYAPASLPKRPHPPLKQWREDGEYVLVLGQKPAVYAAHGFEMEPWLRRTAQEAAERFKTPALIRPHPALPGPRLPSLQAALEDASHVVTLSSTGAVQAVIAGVPTLCLHPTCPAWDVGLTGEWEGRRNREEWIQRLSYRDYDMTDKLELDKAAVYISGAYPFADAHAKVHDTYIRGVRK